MSDALTSIAQLARTTVLHQLTADFNSLPKFLSGLLLLIRDKLRPKPLCQGLFANPDHATMSGV